MVCVTPLLLRAYLAPRFRPKKISETISRILKFDLYLKVSLVASYIELTSRVVLECSSRLEIIIF